MPRIAAVRENNLDSAYMRPMCFYGSEGMGLRADNLKRALYRRGLGMGNLPGPGSTGEMVFVSKHLPSHDIMSTSPCHPGKSQRPVYQFDDGAWRGTERWL